jgi:hypothetical protein
LEIKIIVLISKRFIPGKPILYPNQSNLGLYDLLLLPAAALNPAGSAGRRCLGIAYVFRLAANNISCALIFPNHFGSGIDLAQRGLRGDDRWWAKPQPEYRLKGSEGYEYVFIISPVKN